MFVVHDTSRRVFGSLKVYWNRYRWMDYELVEIWLLLIFNMSMDIQIVHKYLLFNELNRYLYKF